MDFSNLNTEYEALSYKMKQGQSTLLNLSCFFKAKAKQSENLYLSTKSSMDRMFNELIKYENKTILSNQIFAFYKNYESYNTKYKAIIKRLENDIEEPTNVYEKHLNENFKLLLDKFKHNYNNIYNRKNLTDKAKNKYFESCRHVQEKEKSIMKIQEALSKEADDQPNLNNSTLNNSQNKLNLSYDALIEIKVETENLCHAYKKEIEITNEDYAKYENIYFEIISEIKRLEESRLYFIKCHLEKYCIIEKELTQINQEYNERLELIIQDLDIEKDIVNFENKHPLSYCLKDNVRIPREEFLNYEIFKRNLEASLAKPQLYVNTKLDSTKSTSETATGIISGIIGSPLVNMINGNNDNKKEMIPVSYVTDENKLESELNDSAKEFVKIIYDKTEISKDFKKKVFVYLRKNKINDRFKQISNTNFDNNSRKNEAEKIDLVESKETSLNSDSVNIVNNSKIISTNMTNSSSSINSTNNNNINLSYNSLQNADFMNPHSLNSKHTIENKIPILFTKKLIDEIIYRSRRPNTIDFLNKNNYIFFGDVLTEMLYIIKSNESDYFEIFFAVIFLSSKSRFYDKKNHLSYYLSAYIGNKAKKLLKTSSFWLKLIDFKLDSKNLSSEKTVINKYKDFMEAQNKKSTPQANSGLFSISNISSKFKTILNYNSNNKVNFLDLDKHHSIMLRKAYSSNLFFVIKEFIPQLIHFGFNSEIALKLITKLYFEKSKSFFEKSGEEMDQEKDKEVISYFEALIIANKNSIKRKVISCCMETDEMTDMNFGKCNCDVDSKYLDFIENNSNNTNESNKNNSNQKDSTKDSDRNTKDNVSHV